MKRLNNKGQTLVLFVMLLPIMLLLMILVFDVGKFIYSKQELNHISSMVVSYGMEHYDEDDIENELVELVLLNCDDVRNVSVSASDDEVLVDIERMGDSIFGNIINIDMFEVRSSYIGNVTDNKIKRIK